MFVYSVTACALWQSDGKLISTECASGYGDARNMSRLDDMADIGPIPRGLWCILKPFDSKILGAHVMTLLPFNIVGGNMRAGFSMIGNGKLKAGVNGIGMPMGVRLKVSRSKDTELLVIE